MTAETWALRPPSISPPQNAPCPPDGPTAAFPPL
jgi:hypothetical protein